MVFGESKKGSKESKRLCHCLRSPERIVMRFLLLTSLVKSAAAMSSTLPSQLETLQAQALLSNLPTRERYRKATELAKQDWAKGKRAILWKELTNNHVAFKIDS